MRIYFLSAFPCALKINGNFVGRTDGFERYCSLSPKDAPLCEFLPLNGGMPLSFLLDEHLFAHPPKGVSLCILPDGLVVYLESAPTVAPFRLIARERTAAGEVIVFSDGMPQAVIESGGQTVFLRLSEEYEKCAVHAHGDVLLLEGQNALCALHENTEFFRGAVKKWEFDREKAELRLVTPLFDFFGRNADCAWSLRGEAPAQISRTVSAAPPPPPEFLLCACLQNLSLGLDVSDLLSEELFAERETLKAYFGEYERVVPTAKYPFGAGMVCRKAPQVYEMKYYSAEVENGKINNVKREA